MVFTLESCDNFIFYTFICTNLLGYYAPIHPLPLPLSLSLSLLLPPSLSLPSQIIIMSVGSHTIELRTFASRDPVAIRLPDKCTVDKARSEVCKRLGLRPDSTVLFALFLGPIEHPTRLLLDTDVVPIGAEISLQRWNFDVEKELKIARKDDIAINLLYNESTYHLDRGKIHPTDEQYHELESFSDPAFPTERQYHECISAVPGYTAYVAEGCTVLQDISTNDVQITSGTKIDCVLDKHSLAFKENIRKSESIIEWTWTVVRRWQIPSESEIRFEVCLMKGNAPMLCWVNLRTQKAQVLFHTASGICAEVKRSQDRAEGPHPPPNPRLAGKHYDPLIELVDNLLFKGPKFNAIN